LGIVFYTLGIIFLAVIFFVMIACAMFFMVVGHVWQAIILAVGLFIFVLWADSSEKKRQLEIFMQEYEEKKTIN
jgi:Flp pilus assembly protein TadB